MAEREFTDQQLTAAKAFFGTDVPKTRQIRAFVRAQLRQGPLSTEIKHEPKSTLEVGGSVIFERTDAYFHPKFAPYSQTSPQAVAKMTSYGITPRRVV